MNEQKKKILFLLPYPLHKAPSQRFRVEAYFDLLRQNGIQFDTQQFLDENAWQVLYQKGSFFRKTIAVCKGYIKRLAIVFSGLTSYSHVFIHREAAPLGPPFFEWVMAKVLKKKIIYDFDDAIWIPNTSKENRLASWVKAFWKVKYICRSSYKIAGGNEYLCAYARIYNNNVILLPTSVDVVNRYNKIKDHKKGKVVIGWTGSHSTMHYLDEQVTVLKRLASELNVGIMVISNKKPSFDFPNLHFKKWKETTEIEDLLQFDIGIMPLKKDAWSEGKCGFKLIQYLALGIPAVTDAVGVNKKIVEHEKTGFLCETKEEWYASLKTLVENERLRKEMGKVGRENIVNEFSIQANADIFLGLFN
jgi:glycosyltransferase involved in cell wall biosynthesis